MLLLACGQASDKPATIEYLASPVMAGLDLPFAAAVRVDNTLYLSGNIGNIPGTLELAEGGIEGETRRTLENIKLTLESSGSSMEKVVKCTIFLADMSEWSAMNVVYASFFEKQPARSAFGANGLALNARVEIDCIAIVN